jgi:hypothetical protein
MLPYQHAAGSSCCHAWLDCAFTHTCVLCYLVMYHVTCALLLQVYTVGSGKTMPAWLSEAKKRALRKDEDYRCACHSGQGASRSRDLPASASEPA